MINIIIELATVLILIVTYNREIKKDNKWNNKYRKIRRKTYRKFCKDIFFSAVKKSKL